jgi:putative ATP-dependent endonuclease of the OLD family
MFVTTHSTEFVDSVAFQNAYMVSRDAQYKTVCQSITESDGPLLLPSELGLRLSTVFMFDRLLFVEGPSDEAVLRTLAKTLKLDLTKSNIGFVHMCGIRNFAHFAAEGPLELLSRRKNRNVVHRRQR